MAPGKKKQTTRPFPTRAEIARFILESPGPAGKREIARAFNIGAESKAALKTMLRELKDEGVFESGGKNKKDRPGKLRDVMVVALTGVDDMGDVIGRPAVWDGPGEAPVIRMVRERGKPALGGGDKVLARLTPKGGTGRLYEGRLIKRLAATPDEIAGIFRGGPEGGRIQPAGRKIKSEFIVAKEHVQGAKDGDVVRAQVNPGKAAGLPPAKIIECLGAAAGAEAASLLSIAEADIPVAFSPAAEKEAAAAGPAPLQGREDWRDMPLVTIDGEDARDFDDAVFAEPDPDPENEGGFRLIAAIADVAWYVREGGALDNDARERGNSVYFPDRAVPMLPEALSNGWCSLVPGEDRPAMAAEMFINAEGALLRWRFARVMIRSAARLTYTQVHEAQQGKPDKTAAPMMQKSIAPLYDAYAVLAKARRTRGALELETPERRAVIGAGGAVEGVALQRRFESHMLIEEFMILANIAAGTELARRGAGCLYRVHDHPSEERAESLRAVLKTLDLSLARGKLTPARFNAVLKQAARTPHARMIAEMVLRTQAQAVYQPQNIGHFGLALNTYAHFTSPIRRYADLVVHRALIAAHDFGPGGGAADPAALGELGKHLCITERRASGAERKAMDRFVAMFLSEQAGAVFDAHINGAMRAGVFVTLDETGADGLVPMSRLPRDYYEVDSDGRGLTGRSTKRAYYVGMALEVRLIKADPVTGSLLFEPMGQPQGAAPQPPARRTGNRAKHRAKSGAKHGAKKHPKSAKPGGKARKRGPGGAAKKAGKQR